MMRSRTLGCGAKCWERRYGNIDNRAGTAATGAAVTEDRPRDRGLDRAARNVAALSRRYGSPLTVNLPVFGRTVVISDPVLLKDLFAANSDLVERRPNSSRWAR